MPQKAVSIQHSDETRTEQQLTANFTDYADYLSLTRKSCASGAPRLVASSNPSGVMIP